MSKPRCHVAIVGGGLGGLAVAIGIARAGHRVTVIEQAAVLGEIGAGIQVPPNSSRILQHWGLLDKIEAVSVKPRDWAIRSYRDGKVLSKLNLLPYCREEYGAPYLHLHRADYHKILAEEARRLGVEVKLGCTVTGIDFGRPAVHVKDYLGFNSDPLDIIIGADGLKSACREALLGHPDPPKLTGDLAYRIVVKASDMLQHEALRELVENPSIELWMGPQAHVVCYLLRGGNLFNIVLVCPDNLPELVNTQAADLQEMRDFFARWDPRLKILLSMVQETSKWRLQNSEEMQEWSHPLGKFTLLGDACHATLPYLGQGAAMAVEDGAVLGALMEKIEDKSQLKDVLAIYETIRKQRTTRIVERSTAQGEIDHLDDGERQRERDRQLIQEKPFEGYPNPWADPVLQKFCWGYDVYQEVEKAWSAYLREGIHEHLTSRGT